MHFGKQTLLNGLICKTKSMMHIWKNIDLGIFTSDAELENIDLGMDTTVSFQITDIFTSSVGSIAYKNVIGERSICVTK